MKSKKKGKDVAILNNLTGEINISSLKIIQI